MGKKERLRESMLAHKSFLLQLYEAQNREQELGVLSNATNDELHCVLKVIAFIKKGSIPVKAKVRTDKTLKSMQRALGAVNRLIRLLVCI